MITRQSIEGELEYGMVINGKTQKSKNLSAFLNNFYGHLVGGFNRRCCEQLGNMDNKPQNPGHSELARSKTRREFYQEVDQVTQEAGLDEGEILKFQKYHGCEAEDEQERISRRIFPVYIALRQKGYYHYPDLTC